MPILIVMCGLQGSGKTTTAQELKGQIGNCEIISSDAIRQEFNYEIKNDKVFKIYYERAKEFLKAGKNVILDATNITMKSRKQVFEMLKNVPCSKTCYIMNTPLNVCADRLLERNKIVDERAQVPLEVLYRYEKNFEVPFYEEGWDNIEIDEVEQFSDFEYQKLLGVMNMFDQQNSHHKYTLGKHCLMLEKWLKRQNLPKHYFPQCTGMLHDVGKLFTKEIDENGQARYFSHHNVGAYFLLTHTFLIKDINILDLIFFVNYHMLPFTWKEEKTVEKQIAKFGKDKVEKLQILHKGDEEASGTEQTCEK